MLRVIHTSDLHLGARLYNKRRDVEHELFLDWLLQKVEELRIDVLVISGDIFDSTTPSHEAQSLYFSFLARIIRLGFCSVVIIGGNHDSPSFLRAPLPLLEFFDVFVIGDLRDEYLITIKGDEGRIKGIIGAVPYLREGELLSPRQGNSLSEREGILKAAIDEHYTKIISRGNRIRSSLSSPIPFILTGHLFATKGCADHDDRIRDLYVGGIGTVNVENWAKKVSYIALGHLHSFQRILPNVAYSGSPIPLGFNEADRPRRVCFLELDGDRIVEFCALQVPMFKTLKRIEGDLATISQLLSRFTEEGKEMWVEVVYTGEELVGELRKRIEEMVRDSKVEILVVKNHLALGRIFTKEESLLDLREISPLEILRKKMEMEKIPPAQQQEMESLFFEVLSSLRDGAQESIRE